MIEKRMAVRSQKENGWIGIAGVDFGEKGAGKVTVRYRAAEELRQLQEQCLRHWAQW